MTRAEFRAALERRLREASRRGKVTSADLDLITGDADDYAAHEIEEHARSVPWPWPVRKTRKPSARETA